MASLEHCREFLLVCFLVLVAARSIQSAGELNIMVPAYFDPTTNAQAWSDLSTAASQLGPHRVVAIPNPNNGPGTAMSQAYANAISSLQSNTGLAIGYVATGYGARPIAQAQADVDRWYNFYPFVNGIFFDEASNVDGMQAYYQTLYRYVKAKNACSLVVNNPGVSTLESYLFYNGSRVTDVVCIFESGVGALQWSQQPWTMNYDRSNFYALFYNVSVDYQSVISHAYSQNVGWTYVTDDNLPNPWDTRASYLFDEVNYIRNTNYL